MDVRIEERLSPGVAVTVCSDIKMQTGSWSLVLRLIQSVNLYIFDTAGLLEIDVLWESA